LTPTRSQGINSPDRKSTASTTPRVVSYRAPELLLSQSARRRNFYGPRTISYSFEESERASAAYEDIQDSDNDSNSSRPRPVGQMSLREELRGSSLHSVSVSSIIAASPSEFARSQRSASEASQAAEQSLERRHAILSSTQLQLPPPFSAVSRRLSFTGSLPSAARDKLDMRITPTTIEQYTDTANQSSPARIAPLEGPAETEHPNPAVNFL
jgi:hypothetical protein